MICEYSTRLGQPKIQLRTVPRGSQEGFAANSWPSVSPALTPESARLTAPRTTPWPYIST